MPASSNDPFESPKALIQGAKEDLANVEALIDAYRADATCAPIVHYDRQTAHKFIKLRIVNAPPPRIRYLVSGILNNLRHCLDQAANAAAVELRGGERNGYFPFAKDISDIDHIIKKNCKTFPAELTEYLISFKPYGGGDDLLYALSKVAGSNKHRITVEILPNLQGFTVNDFIHRFRGPGVLGMLGWDPDKRELTFARLESSISYVTTSIDDRTRLPFHMEVGGHPAFAGNQAAVLLNSLIAKVERILVGMEAETARLKAGCP